MKISLPIYRKLFLSHFLAVFLVCGSSGAYFYISAVESLQTSLESRLSNSAALLGEILDAAKLDTIRDGADQATPIYQDYVELLRSFRRANPDISGMYVMRRAGDRVYFVIDADETSTQALPGHEYVTFVPTLLEGFSHPSVDHQIYTDEYGSTMSGYAPIKDGVGRYLIGIDMDATEVSNKFRTLRLSGLIALFLGLILAIFLGRYLARQFTTPIGLLITRCQAIAKGKLDDLVKFQSGDELDDLISAVNTMSSRLSESREQFRQAEEALKQANNDLEWRIEERTKELRELNDQLHVEVAIRTQTLAYLRASEEHYRELADLLPQPVFEVDGNGNLTFFNRAAFDLFGYTHEDFEGGLQLHEILATEESEKILEETRQPLPGKKVECTEHTAKRKGGGTFPVCTYVNPIMVGEKADGMRGIIVDMSERKLMEQELLKAQKLESLSVLAGGIAHDFNNLLMAIMGSVSLARQLVNPEGKLSKLLDDAEGASLQAKTLTGQFISLAQMSTPVKHTLPIGDCIKDAAEFALCGSKVTCSFQMNEELWPVCCHPAQIRQMVVNLVENSKEAMPAGGLIDFEAKNVEIAPFEVPSLGAGKYVQLTIKDSGVGIREPDLSRIFDPYFSTKERGSQKGMGLGLTIAYSVIKKHDGHIRMRSSPGVGTEVNVYLPAAAMQPV